MIFLLEGRANRDWNLETRFDTIIWTVLLRKTLYHRFFSRKRYYSIFRENRLTQQTTLVPFVMDLVKAVQSPKLARWQLSNVNLRSIPACETRGKLTSVLHEIPRNSLWKEASVVRIIRSPSLRPRSNFVPDLFIADHRRYVRDNIIHDTLCKRHY